MAANQERKSLSADESVLATAKGNWGANAPILGKRVRENAIWAKKFGVSETYIKRARKIVKVSRQHATEIIAGRKTIAQCERELGLDKPRNGAQIPRFRVRLTAEQAMLATANGPFIPPRGSRFEIILADPPSCA